MRKFETLQRYDIRRDHDLEDLYDVDKKLIFQVHKVLVGSPADKDGRIQKGDRILSINGRNMKGVTHREALSILKVNSEKFSRLVYINGEL